MYFLDNWVPHAKIVPAFRGHVNSVALVARPVEGTHVKYSCFHRAGMASVQPILVDEPIELDASHRDIIMSKLINAHAAAYELLYGDRMRRAWDEELNTMATKVEAAPPAAGKSRRAGTVTRK